jgi:hypothetical protein
MSTLGSGWSRLGIFIAAIAILVVVMTLSSIQGAEARTTLQATYAISPNSFCRVLSPEETAAHVSAKFAEMTSAAVSPLLTITTVGWVRYLCTEEQHRHLLPWYYQSGFLTLTLVVLLFLTFKDTLLAPLGPFKQPLDALGEFIHTASGLVALPIGVIYFADSVSSPITSSVTSMVHGLMPTAYAADGSVPLANLSGLLLPLGHFLGVSLGLVTFSANWVFGNIFDVLIMICPIPFVDTTLSGIRSTLMGVMISLSFFSPILGGIFALILLAISLGFFSWAFRLLTLGMVYCGDILRLKWRRFKVDNQGILAFSGAAMPRTKAGFLGRALPGDQQSITFYYYPYLVLPRKKVMVPVGTANSSEVMLTRGFVAPTATQVDLLSGKTSTLLRLPPRYRNHEEAVAHYLGLATQHQTSADKGRGWFGWLGAIF